MIGDTLNYTYLMTCKLEKKNSMIVNTKNNTYKMTYKKTWKKKRVHS